MKIKLCLFSLSILLVSTSVNSLFAQTTGKVITDAFFALYLKDPAKAVEYAFSTNKYMLKKPEVVTNVKTQLKSLSSVLGTYYGNELISDKSISPSFREVKFLIKYDREPIQFTFLLYKPFNSWLVLNFSYNENLDKEIAAAEKSK